MDIPLTSLEPFGYTGMPILCMDTRDMRDILRSFILADIKQGLAPTDIKRRVVGDAYMLGFESAEAHLALEQGTYLIKVILEFPKGKAVPSVKVLWSDAR